MPRKLVATLPFASRAVTVTANGWPATAVAGALRLRPTALPIRVASFAALSIVVATAPNPVATASTAPSPFRSPSAM